jgi:acyl-CoA synthetase (AMP-forming)/AMP-acid ligase II
VDWVLPQLKGFESKIAGFESGKEWTYLEFVEEILKIRKNLSELDPSKPQVVFLSIESTLWSLAAILAAAHTPHIILPISTEVPLVEQKQQMKIAGASFSLTQEGIKPLADTQLSGPLLHELSKRAHAGLILFSSGTSGQPKGMLHDLVEFLKRFQRAQPREDRLVQLLLPDHVGGLDSAFRTIFSGSALIIPQTRNPEDVARAIAFYSANILPASPTFLNLLLLSGALASSNHSSLKVIAYGAELMPPALLKRLNEAFPEVELQQKFGTSETGAIRIKGAGNQSLDFRINDKDVEWKVVEDELWLRTSSRILGYLNADESSLEADGWYRTGDAVEQYGDGWLRIKGRQSSVINVGGQKVHPSEVEALLGEVAGIESVAVFGEISPILGEQVACRIVTKGKEEARVWKRNIRKHCRGRLADWKIPVVIYLETEIEMTQRLKRTGQGA